MERCYSPRIKRYDFSPGNGTFVCANHFVDGQPTREYPNSTVFLSVLKNKFDKTPQKRRLLDKEASTSASNDSLGDNVEMDFGIEPLPEVPEDKETELEVVEPEDVHNEPSPQVPLFYQ